MTQYELEDIKTIATLPYNWTRVDNSTIVISGGTGFIGSFVSDVFRYRNRILGTKTKIISLSRKGGISDDTVTYLKADITKPFNYEGDIDYIIHLASNTHPKQYAEDPVGTIITNIVGCDNLFKLAMRKKIKRFVLASSVEIYGQGTEVPMTEEYCGYIDCNSARNGYNEAKRTCESLCMSYHSQHKIDYVTARFSRVFGADRKRDTKAISQFMTRATSNQDIIIKSSGTQRYSYVYIADAASGLIKILLDGVVGEAYNISGDDEGKTLGDYAQLIANFAKRKVSFDIENNANVSKATYALLDTNKIKNLGWKPLYGVSEALKRTYEIDKEIINQYK